MASFLIRLDVGVPGAILRILLGLLVGLALRLAGRPSWALSLAVLLASLFALKAAAAVGRKLARPGPEVRSHWDWRRGLARDHDSYQWRKLVWVGTGLLLGTAPWGDPAAAPCGLGLACLAAGALGEVAWRRTGLSQVPPQRS